MKIITTSGYVWSCDVKSVARQDGSGSFMSGRIRLKHVGRERNRKTGQYEKVATWFTLETVGAKAEHWDRFKKDDVVDVSGKLVIEEYTNKNGQPAFSLVIDDADVEWAPRASTDAEQGDAQSTQRYGQPQQADADDDVDF